jgi:hypothetical protein
MTEYHKINTIFKRDMASKHKNIVVGDWVNDTFEYLAKNQWVFTEKVDGTNIRVIFEDDKVSFAGRTDAAQIPPKLLQHLQKTFQPQSDFFDGQSVVLYGEGYGGKIQSGGHYGFDESFVLFDVKVGDIWLERRNVEDIATKLSRLMNRVPVVPIIGSGTLFRAVELAAAGIKSTWGDFQAEGIVARPAVELMTRRGERVITKIKTVDFKGLIDGCDS